MLLGQEELCYTHAQLKAISDNCAGTTSFLQNQIKAMSQAMHIYGPELFFAKLSSDYILAPFIVETPL